MYAEELCFAPKYERVRALVEAGAVGDVYMLKQAEKHSGPHSRWFYQKETAGGGVMMDMGCHALAWFRWMNKNNPVQERLRRHEDRAAQGDHRLRRQHRHPGGV